MALVSHSPVVVWIHVRWEERPRHPQVYKVIHPQVYKVIRHFLKEKGTGADIAILVWPWKMVSVCSLFVLSAQGAKKIIFTACHSGKLKLAFTSPDVISTSPKNFLFFCYSNSS